MDSNPEACAASSGEAGATYTGLRLSPSFSQSLPIFSSRQLPFAEVFLICSPEMSRIW